MKKLYFTLLFLIIGFLAQAQNISVADFYLAENDLTARTHGTSVEDQNGNLCALIKVRTTEKGLWTFDVGMLGVTKTEMQNATHAAEIWVWVPFSVTRITIQHERFGLLDKWRFPCDIAKGYTYVMTLVTVDNQPKIVPATTSISAETQVPSQQLSTVSTYDILPGVFSVSDNNKVHFAKGNLQYQASTNSWRFAENQWDCIGTGNKYISPSYDGWIDLFGWGTGNNPTKISSDYRDYPTFSDWGDKIRGSWRTLTKDEWKYVLHNRDTNSGIRYVKATVNGMCGIILLPDDWNKTSYALNKTNNGGANFSSNTISSSTWNTTFAPAGAVFLPAAGYRSGTSVESVGSFCSYWSASAGTNETAHSVLSFRIYLFPTNIQDRFQARSVRLVTPAE